MGLTGVDHAIIAVYFAATLGAGLLLSRRAGRGILHYFLGGREVPWWAIGMSGTASNFDMTGTMVVISFLFAIGLQGFWVSMRGGLGLPLGIVMVYMGMWLRRSNVMTNAEWMQIRFGDGAAGRAARLLSAVAQLIMAIAFLTYFVEGTGKFLAVFLPWSPDVCAVLMIGFAAVYTALSGFYGVIWTDVLQELLILGVSLYVGYQAFTLPEHAEVIASAGEAWASFAPRWEAEPMQWLADPAMYQMFGLCVVFWVARGFLEGAGGFGGGYMPQRYYAAKGERQVGLLTAEWIVLLFFRWSLIVGVAVLGLSLAMKSPEIAAVLEDDPERTLPVVLGEAIPTGIRGVLVAGLIAAAMSTFDSTVNAGVSYWVRDIYQGYVRPGASERQLMRQSRAGTVVLSAAAAVCGLAIDNINQIWNLITGPLSAGLFAPLFLRWYWWRLNGWGFGLSTIAGLITSAVLQVAAPGLAFYISFPLTFAIAVTTAIVVSFATPPAPREVLVAFWTRIRPFGLWRPVNREVGDEGLVRRTARRNRRDIANVPLAIAWHVTGIVATISLILHKWMTLGRAAGAFAVLTAVLYVTWYRPLPAADAGGDESEADG